jgi:hypothetical protein
VPCAGAQKGRGTEILHAENPKTLQTGEAGKDEVCLPRRKPRDASRDGDGYPKARHICGRPLLLAAAGSTALSGASRCLFFFVLGSGLLFGEPCRSQPQGQHLRAGQSKRKKGDQKRGEQPALHSVARLTIGKVQVNNHLVRRM